MSEEKWLVVLNPNAGGRLAEKEWPQIEKELKQQNFSFDLCKTEKPLHAVQLVEKKIKEGFRKIIAVGGDGTLHEVVNGIMKQKLVNADDILLAMISIGTGNDWIKTHGISSDYKEAIQQIKNGNTIKQDVGKIIFKNGSVNPEVRYFINSVGIGFDASVVKYILPQKKKGKSSKKEYVIGLIKSLFTNKNILTRLQLDENIIQTKVYNLTVGLCRYKGGGFKMSPNAVPNDGKLDITLASKISKRKIISCLPKLMAGKIEKIKYFDFYQVKNLILHASGPMCTEADGEYLGLYPLQVSIIPSKIKLISNFKPDKLI
ncbi:MAG TPA: diacylglycerol kinase family lipid kinase [Prolixibacteraceae bacterium]|nr:diacylglycerol kinase family lipid kinase [Prolixibacteraceae bacterium]